MQKTVNAYDWRNHNMSLLQELEPGDLIEFPRGVYSHWAVYCGDEEVIHLAGVGNDGLNGASGSQHSISVAGKMFHKAEVCRDNFWNVVEYSFARKNYSSDSQMGALSKREILSNAMKHMGEVGYNLITSNCEHFAKYCRYGTAKSDQVENAIGVAVAVGDLALLGAALGKFVYNYNKQSHEKERKEKR